jgi:CARDB
MLPAVLLATAALAAPVPSLSAKVATCTTGVADEQRAAAFTGSMPAAAGTKRLQMRFVLTQRLGTSAKAPFKKLAVPGWGGWEKSDPGRQGFVFTKRIEALTAPASYRATITFRWLDAKGHTQRTTTRTTPTCALADPRPDLVLDGVDAVPAGRSLAAYTVAVGNEGHADADPFAVTVTVGDVVSDPLILGPLVAGGRVSGTLAAPKCAPGSTITVTIDAAGAVAESTEDDDVVERPCPLA